MSFLCRCIILTLITWHTIYLFFLIGHFSEHVIQNAYVSFRQMCGTHISKYACPGWANLLSSHSLTLSVTFSSALGNISERDCFSGVPYYGNIHKKVKRRGLSSSSPFSMKLNPGDTTRLVGINCEQRRRVQTIFSSLCMSKFLWCVLCNSL